MTERTGGQLGRCFGCASNLPVSDRPNLGVGSARFVKGAERLAPLFSHVTQDRGSYCPASLNHSREAFFCGEVVACTERVHHLVSSSQGPVGDARVITVWRLSDLLDHLKVQFEIDRFRIHVH